VGYLKRGVDYIGVGVGAVIAGKNGKFFLTKRGKLAKNERGKWEFPGGGVEFGETLQEALKREIREEYGVEIQVIELLGVCDHIIEKENQHWVSPTFVCKIRNGVPRILEPGKCSKIGWFSILEMRKMRLSIITKHDLKLLLEKPKEHFNRL
jgi:mutator protein MutT